MPHTSLIDWGGFVGEIGQVYIISYDKTDIVPIDSKLKNQYIIENESNELIAIRNGLNGYPKVRINKVVGHKISIEECRRIAKIQIESGYTTLAEIRKKTNLI